PEKWAKEYAERDRLVTAPTAPALRERLADDWWASRERGDDALMVALRRRDVADLNQLGRERMRAGERRRSKDIEVGTRAFAIGERVVLGRNDRDLDVVNGER